jgi:hypothetical protein
MKTRGREYLAKAKQYEERAKKVRCPDREWHLTLARAYRMLAEAESEAQTRRQPKAA